MRPMLAANSGVGRHERGQRVGLVVRVDHGGLGNQGHGHVACRKPGELWEKYIRYWLCERSTGQTYHCTR